MILVNLLKFKQNSLKQYQIETFIIEITYFQELKLSLYTVPYLEYPRHSVVCFPTVEEIN